MNLASRCATDGQVCYMRYADGARCNTCCPMLRPAGIVVEVSATTHRPGADDALRLGRRRFQAGERLDMSAVADTLGINRVTLYRWFGSRDKFVVEVLWSLARQALDAAAATIETRGPQRLVGRVGGSPALVTTNPGMQRCPPDAGEHAMRLPPRHDTDFQPRLIAAFEAVLREEADHG